MNIKELQLLVLSQLSELGFSIVRFASPELGEAKQRFSEWLDKGYHGEMAYLSRRQEERKNPSQLISELASVIVLAYPYDCGLENTADPKIGIVSRYAWGRDYHEVLQQKLKTFQSWLSSKIPDALCYLSTDAQPVLEKAWAEKAGLGWMGKHSNIIHAKQGSYFFLSTILTDLPFQPDEIAQSHCGSCERCIQACPTGAIIAPYVVDARLCISYLTIELKGAIPRHLRHLIGNRIFGCDDCQEVCPWNRFSQTTKEKAFFPREGIRKTSLKEWINIKPEEFKSKFQHSPLLRTKWKGLMRNVLVAIGNSRDSSLLPQVKEKLKCEDPLVRGHAVWAYAELLKSASTETLKQMQNCETDAFVLSEIEQSLKVFAGQS